MSTILTESLSIAVIAYRLGLDPRKEIGFGYDAEHERMAVYIHRPGRPIIRVRIPEPVIPPETVNKLAEAWMVSFRSIAEGVTPESYVNSILERSLFKKHRLESFVLYLMDRNIIGQKAFKLDGDSYWRCAVCTEAMEYEVTSRAERDLCNACLGLS